MDTTLTHSLRTRSLSPNLDWMAEKRATNFSPTGVSCRAPYSLNKFWMYPFACVLQTSSSFIFSAKKKSSPEPSLVEEVVVEYNEDEDGNEGLLLDDFEDEGINGDDYLEDEDIEEETRAGDGCGGGGVSLAGTTWDRNALAIAEEVAQSFGSEIGVYAFKTSLNSSIKVRIERLTNKSGSPSMKDIEDFSSAYKARLEEAAIQESVPDDIYLEVSSPGCERVVQVPEDLERFKDRALYVKYISGVAESGATSEHDGIFKLISVDVEAKSCSWGLADARINREKAGKGRPLSKKQRQWRLETSFNSLVLVRFYPEI